jgi:undecaprenyl-diphosphatase
LFARPSQAALFLIANGAILYGAELLRRKARTEEGKGVSLDEGIVKLSYKQAVGIGAAQALALFPGISRTGSSLAGGLLARLNHEEAIRFSFLLATPLIFAAGVLKLPKLLHAPASSVFTIVLGSLVSAGAARR